MPKPRTFHRGDTGPGTRRQNQDPKTRAVRLYPWASTPGGYYAPADVAVLQVRDVVAHLTAAELRDLGSAAHSLAAGIEPDSAHRVDADNYSMRTSRARREAMAEAISDDVRDAVRDAESVPYSWVLARLRAQPEDVWETEIQSGVRKHEDDWWVPWSDVNGGFYASPGETPADALIAFDEALRDGSVAGREPDLGPRLGEAVHGVRFRNDSEADWTYFRRTPAGYGDPPGPWEEGRPC